MSTGQADSLPPDPDDFFKDTRMSFADHIEELRQHLWRAVYGFLIALFFSLFIGKAVLDIITGPVKTQLDAYYGRHMARVLAEQAGVKPEQLSLFRRHAFYRKQLKALILGEEVPQDRPVIKPDEEAEKEKLAEEGKAPARTGFLGVLDSISSLWASLGGEAGSEKAALSSDWSGPTTTIRESDQGKELVYLWVRQENALVAGADVAKSIRELLKIDSPTTLRAEEAFFVWFKVCMVTGLVLGSPWIFYQIWAFVAAGLYPHEKRLVHFYLPISLGLFLFGVVICQVAVIPRALGALLWFNEWLGIKPDIRLNDWLGFAIFMPVVFGVSFQTPLVMLLLNRLGIMSGERFAASRRMAWFFMAVFAAMITPSTDAFSMLFLWVPMSLLFELGILLIWMSPPPQASEEDSEAGELVEI
jgi:sec-independent protein translocase protein TatC